MMMNHAPLQALVGDRIFAKKTMTSSREEHPYIVYKLGHNTSENLAEDQLVTRQFLQIFVHDFADYETGTYDRVDEVLSILKDLFFQQSSSADGVIAIQYLETSQDLDDQTLSTMLKYARFVLIIKEK
jgi:hypothetical protein